MSNPAQIRFWGTRGSLAKPGPRTLRYGGNTACVQLTSPSGALVVIDCGTGAHGLGQSLLADAKGPLRGSLLISHTHWDHIQGFPFFAPLFVKGGRWDVYGPAGMGQSLRETLAGQMQYSYFPVSLDDMGAAIRFHDLVEGNLEIEDIRITTWFLNHPALTLGYRFEMDGICVVYACDHEPFLRKIGVTADPDEGDQRHASFLKGADLLIHDAQFVDSEYEKKRGWGHSTMEYVVEIAQLAGVKQVAFTHHDPMRSDDELDVIALGIRQRLAAAQSELTVFPAAEQQMIEFRGAENSGPRKGIQWPAAAPAVKDVVVLAGIADKKLDSLVAGAVQADHVRFCQAVDGESLLALARNAPPTLIVAEENLPGLGGFDLCKRLRLEPGARLHDIPVVIIADKEKPDEGRLAGVSSWLIKPFSEQYARAHLQAWLMRSRCRWVRAAVPPDESRRLAALRSLAILDTPPEDRFDQITRLAMLLGKVPIATLTLIDEDRQWFKSSVGCENKDGTREQAFCAHVVHERKPIVVSDTLLDHRFADNPLVTSGPRIRAYCGFPVFHEDGSCLGTLCMIDTRPRDFSEPMLQRLGDLASLAQKELNRSASEKK